MSYKENKERTYVDEVGHVAILQHFHDFAFVDRIKHNLRGQPRAQDARVRDAAMHTRSSKAFLDAILRAN